MIQPGDVTWVTGYLPIPAPRLELPLGESTNRSDDGIMRLAIRSSP